jgi:hypothetical protein
MVDRADLDGDALRANRPVSDPETGHARDHVQPTKLLRRNDFVKFGRNHRLSAPNGLQHQLRMVLCHLEQA